MEKYLYLNEINHAETWIKGGEMPIGMASKYKSELREGTKTPDENLIEQSNFPVAGLKPYGIDLDCPIYNSTFDLGPGLLVDVKEHYREDGRLLSFCNHFSEKTAIKFGNKKACVKILNIEKTKKKLDKRLGQMGIMKDCAYTDGHQRNHFLKSTKDAWQDEFRIFWNVHKSENISDDRLVEILPGTAELIWVFS